MANLSRDRSNRIPSRKPSLPRLAWGLLKLALAIGLAIIAAMLIMATINNGL